MDVERSTPEQTKSTVKPNSTLFSVQVTNPKPLKKEPLERQLDRMTGEGGPAPEPIAPTTAPAWETRNSISASVRSQTVELLQGELAESIDLVARIKNAHWNVKGPNFIALHKLLDEIAAECFEFSDLIAERITQLGGTAQGNLRHVVQCSALPDLEISAVSETGDNYLQDVAHSLAAFGESTRNMILKIDHSDPVTADIFTEITRGIDKNLWFLEAHMQKKVSSSYN